MRSRGTRSSWIVTVASAFGAAFAASVTAGWRVARRPTQGGGAAESARLAVAWARENLTDLYDGEPEVTGSETFVALSDA